MAVFKRNVHLGTKEPLIETDDIADKAVTSEKIDDKAVAMPKIGDDVKQYIATQVGTETTDREGEIERLEGLIGLERSDRDTEEGAIWADVRKKANIVDIRDYMSENVRLPLNGAYNYEGIPVTAVPANIDTASVIEGVSPDDSDIETFILFRVEADVSYKPAHLFYVCFWENGRYANRWFANDAPEDVKRVFNDNIVASDVAGLMSATDKNNLDTAVSDLSVVKGKISPAASSSNQLTDRDFVNSSIATNTATFQGTYNSIAEATEQVEDADLNDYIFIVRTDDAGNTLYDRYKWGHRGWVFEYTLNNSSFTAEQWAAINSGLTRNDRSIIDAANSNASTALTNSQNAVLTASTASSNASNAVEVADNNAHIVANLEGAFTGTSPIYDFSPETEYGIDGNKVRCCYKDDLLYRAITTHTGAWDASHFEQISVFDLLKVLCGIEEIPTWESIKSQPTTVGTLVIYEDKLYKFDVARAADEEWDSTKVHLTSLWAEIDAMVKSDYEQVNIELKTETGEALPNVEVVVTVEGEEAPRNLTTDNTGKCTTNIPKGVEYIVEANAVEDYAEPEKVIRRAALPKRYIEIVYSAILDVEHVVVEADYADTSLGTATEIYVEIDGEEFTIPLEGNQATFDVDFGKTYTISFQSVDGYMTPHTRTYKAMHASTKLVIARYMKPIDNVKWLMADGTLREVNNVTDEERLEGNIYGCVVGNSELVTNQKCYTIPTQYLLSGQYPYTGNYLSQNMQITAIGFYDTHGKALLDIDGEFNCTKIREFISEKASQGTNISSTIAQATYNTYGGYEEFNSNRDYYAGRSVVYEGSIYQFRSRHNKAEWNGNDVQMLYAGFDSSRSYMVGETVFRGGFLWTFKSAHNAGDAWNTSEVNRTNGWIMPDGTLKHAFTPAYGQLYAYRNIRNDLNTVTQSIFSAQCLPISGENIWTSTQCNAQNGVYLYNGGFNFNGKAYSNYMVLPVLAYSD